jgi:hypothetical protein
VTETADPEVRVVRTWPAAKGWLRTFSAVVVNFVPTTLGTAVGLADALAGPLARGRRVEGWGDALAVALLTVLGVGVAAFRGVRLALRLTFSGSADDGGWLADAVG